MRGSYVLAVALALTGCAHVHDSGQNEDLDHAVDLYWKASHWQDAIAGSAFVYEDQRAEWLRTRDKKEKDLNVTSFEVQGEKVAKDGRSAKVFVKCTWFLLPSLVEQTDLAEERWLYKDGHWMLVSEKGGPLPFP